MSVTSYVSDILISTEYLWIGDIKVSSPNFDEMEIKLPRVGIDKEIDDRELWSDAYSIQAEIYNKLKKDPGHPDDGDPYWKLWENYKELLNIKE